jgi:hypothetical protein
MEAYTDVQGQNYYVSRPANRIPCKLLEQATGSAQRDIARMVWSKFHYTNIFLAFPSTLQPILYGKRRF